MRLLHENYVVSISILGSVFTAIHLFFSIRIATQRQELAYAGDAAAAKRIILPCYKPLVRGLLIFYLTFAIALALTYVNPDVDVHRIIQYYCFSLLTTYCITPVMLIQTSVSAIAFWRTFYTIFPYWAFNTLLFGLVDVGGSSNVAFSSLFVICTTLPPLILSAGILTKTISSRVQLGSNSNRNSTEVLLVYSLCFGLIFSVGVGCAHHHDSSLSGESCNTTTDIVMVVLTFVINQLYPFALYRTLLADTKFWRGVGTHNQGGFLVDEALRATGVNLHRPTMEFNVASTTFQAMMADIHDLTIDFAFLALEKEIGQGATARVFCGKYKKKMVAVKLSTPPEITEEVIDVFVAEAKISSLFKHRNIVQFLGICVRPPQIGMVFEFCDGGALKTHLQKNPNLWTPMQRLRGCLDAARAVEHLHENGYIHRDLKADNFFVARKLTVKLGDFGEATRIPHRRYSERLSERSSEAKVNNADISIDSSNEGGKRQSKRMTILGTVAFMAPELVNNARTYTESIDIYALGVTFWEIWTGHDPYDGLTTFQIYDKVKQGQRPEIPSDCPEGLRTLLQDMWVEDVDERVGASQVVRRLEQTMADRLNGTDSAADAASHLSVDGESSANSSRNNSNAPQRSVADQDDDSDSGPTPGATVNPLLVAVRAVSQHFSSGSSTSANTSPNTTGTAGTKRKPSVLFALDNNAATSAGTSSNNGSGSGDGRSNAQGVAVDTSDSSVSPLHTESAPAAVELSPASSSSEQTAAATTAPPDSQSEPQGDDDVGSEDDGDGDTPQSSPDHPSGTSSAAPWRTLNLGELGSSSSSVSLLTPQATTATTTSTSTTNITTSSSSEPVSLAALRPAASTAAPRTPSRDFFSAADADDDDEDER